MAAEEPFEIPVGMRSVCRRFERWRARLSISEALWVVAAKPARQHGLSAHPRPCAWNTSSSNR
jgi:hypothetical protein